MRRAVVYLQRKAATIRRLSNEEELLTAIGQVRGVHVHVSCAHVHRRSSSPRSGRYVVCMCMCRVRMCTHDVHMHMHVCAHAHAQVAGADGDVRLLSDAPPMPLAATASLLARAACLIGVHGGE